MNLPNRKELQNLVKLFKGVRLVFLCGIFSLGVAVEILLAAAENGEMSEHIHLPTFAIITGVVTVASFLFGWLANQIRNDRLYMKVASCERIRIDCRDRQGIKTEGFDDRMENLQDSINEAKIDIKELRECNQRTHEAIVALTAKLDLNSLRL